jgi:SlyX protein
MNHDASIAVLESRLSWLENTVAELNDVVTSQAKLLEKMQAEIKELGGNYRDLRDIAEGDVPNRKPPHY